MFATSIKLRYFFDRPEVIARLQQKERKVLSGTGAFARLAIKRSMRPGGKSQFNSKPGEPPRYQTKLLRDHILFAFDETKNSVVVGPRVLNGRKARYIPALLQFGGDTVVDEKVLVATIKLRGRGRKQLWQPTGRRLKVRIAPRPYVGPAARATWTPILNKWRQLIANTKF